MTPIDWASVDLFHQGPLPCADSEERQRARVHDCEPEQRWPWRKMMSRLDDATLKRIIGDGITGIFCQPIPCCDHKRDQFATHGGEHVVPIAHAPVWDVVTHRCDGGRARAHSTGVRPTMISGPR